MADQLGRQLDELRNDVRRLNEEVEQADLVRVLARLAVVERRLDEFGNVRDEVRRVAAIEERVAELKRAKEESEKRHWQFVYIFAGAMASLLVTVVVQLVLAAVKKP